MKNEKVQVQDKTDANKKKWGLNVLVVVELIFQAWFVIRIPSLNCFNNFL